MATRNSVDVGLSGFSGVGNFAGTSGPILSGPLVNQISDTNGAISIQFTPIASAVNYLNLENAATGNSVNLVAKGTDTNIQLRLAGQGNSGAALAGVSTNNAAVAGYVGEYISSTVVQGSPVPLTTVTAANVTSISLTAGDWQVWGNVSFAMGVTANLVIAVSSIGSTSATIGAAEIRGGYTAPTPSGSVIVNDVYTSCATQRFLLSGTTTIYLIGYAQFSVSTCAAYGGIYARRMR